VPITFTTTSICKQVIKLVTTLKISFRNMIVLLTLEVLQKSVAEKIV